MIIDLIPISTLAITDPIVAELGQPSFRCEGDIRERLEFRGMLNLSYDDFKTSACADCSFVITDLWMFEMPTIRCFSPWLYDGGKPNLEWHLLADRKLCWEYNPKWTDVLLTKSHKNGSGATADLAAAWCLRSVRWLLSRHFDAACSGQKEWNSAFQYWGHYGEAGREYLGSRKGEFAHYLS